ncbi:unnamed protein product [Paramecium sonneborni]|uniref:Transmembrane protein n=1 Tax=Paramecium sonneborni TaxID=65129 RepID=A0A8S1RCQ7_9CILI|nr:unnamed protein product [Paramecium sonneborni]
MLEHNNTILIRIVLLALYLKSVLSQCQILSLPSNQIYVSNNTESRLIEKDSYDQFNFLNDQIEPQFQIPIYNAKIVQTIFIESISTEFLSEKWLCQFIHENKNIYYISCIDIIFIDEEGNANYYNKERLTLLVEVSPDETCHQFYLEGTLEFLIFCRKYQHFSIYSVDFFNQTKQALSYKYDNFECLKQTIEKNDKGYYLISFFNCENWSILKFQDNKINILANPQIFQDLKYDKISSLINIQFCQNLVVLIEKDQYTVFTLAESLIFYANVKVENFFIEKIVFTNTCNFQYYFGKAKINTIKIVKGDNQFEKVIDQKTIDILQAFHSLFLFSQEKLQIGWFDEQIIEIKCFSCNFNIIQTYNLFYIIDLQNQQIRFFKINVFVNYLKPTKKFIYEISNNPFQKSELQCFEIQETQFPKPNSIKHEFKNNCQEKEEILVKKEEYNFPIHQDFEIFGEYENRITYILGNVYLKDYCPIIEENLKGKQLIYFQFNILENQGVLLSDDMLSVYFCNNQSSVSKEIKNYQVLNYQNIIFMIKEKPQLAKAILFQIGNNQQQEEFLIQSNILQKLQYQQFIILVTQDQQEMTLIDLLQKRKLNIPKQFKDILIWVVTQSSKKKKLQFFIAKFKYFDIYQLNQYLVIQLSDLITLYKVNDITIVYAGKSKFILDSQSIQNKYSLIAVHNKKNIIKQYILDNRLKLLENYEIENYDIIRPILYQINKENLIIALKQLDLNYLFVFQIQQPLKLLQILKISKLDFYLQNDFIIYYDDDLNIRILDIDKLQIQYLNPAENQKQIVLYETIPIQLKHEFEANQQDQLYLDLKVINYCRNLYSSLTEHTIYVEDSEQIRIENIDLFSGPIDQLVLENNSKLKLIGPFINQQKIEDCQNQLTVCYKVIQYELYQNNAELTLFYNLRHYNKLKLLPFYLQKNLKENKINIKDAYFYKRNLVLVLYEKENSVFASVINYNIDQLSQQFEPIKLQGLQVKDFNRVQFQQTGTLMFIKYGSLERILKINQTNIIEIDLEIYFSNILFIENSPNQYIEMKIIKKIDESYFLINVFQLKMIEFLIVDSYKINYQLIEKTLSPHINIDIYQLKQYFQNQLFESFLDENRIEIKVLQITLSFSVISKIQINQKNGEIIYTVEQVFRNPKSQELLNFKYFDENILILINSKDNTSYLYYIKQIKPFYDYIFMFDNNLLNFYPLNTTHYLFYFNQIDQLFIGEIGFQLQKLQELDDYETCIIKASNQVSKEQIRLIIKKITFLSNNGVLITSSGILLGSYYLYRRQKLKQIIKILQKLMNDHFIKQIHININQKVVDLNLKSYNEILFIDKIFDFFQF